jgi:hypothetical protein
MTVGLYLNVNDVDVVKVPEYTLVAVTTAYVVKELDVEFASEIGVSIVGVPAKITVPDGSVGTNVEFESLFEYTSVK